MNKTSTVTAIALASILLAACAITQNVRPVTARDMSLLCIKKNPEVMMGGFLGELESQLQKRGLKTRTYEGSAPAGCKHRLEYTANWRWDLAMYLVFAELNVYENDLLVGQASYDARAGGGRMDKFGPTADKLRGLVDELFAQAQVAR